MDLFTARSDTTMPICVMFCTLLSYAKLEVAVLQPMTKMCNKGAVSPACTCDGDLLWTLCYLVRSGTH